MGYETEGLGRVDELEGSKNKLSARVQEAEETIESLNQKVASTEKAKHRLETELEDSQLEYERVHAAAIITERRGKNFDKVVGEWKAKVDDLVAEIEASQKEYRNYNSELFRLKAAWDETVEQLDVVKRENKNLADEIKDLLDQLGDGGRSIHVLDKQRRRLEVEKEELQAALEEAEAALEQEENRVLRAQLELGQVRQEIDRKIQEKEEEFDNTRKNHQRAMDSMQASLEAETKAKAEALRIKEELESDEFIDAIKEAMESGGSPMQKLDALKAAMEEEMNSVTNALRNTFINKIPTQEEIDKACNTLAEKLGADASARTDVKLALVDVLNEALQDVLEYEPDGAMLFNYLMVAAIAAAADIIERNSLKPTGSDLQEIARKEMLEMIERLLMEAELLDELSKLDVYGKTIDG